MSAHMLDMAAVAMGMSAHMLATGFLASLSLKVTPNSRELYLEKKEREVRKNGSQKCLKDTDFDSLKKKV